MSKNDLNNIAENMGQTLKDNEDPGEDHVFPQNNPTDEKDEPKGLDNTDETEELEFVAGDMGDIPDYGHENIKWKLYSIQTNRHGITTVTEVMANKPGQSAAAYGVILKITTIQDEKVMAVNTEQLANMKLKYLDSRNPDIGFAIVNKNASDR
ncbi:MAG: hypothetical protein HOD11_08025 [Candidatus Marinimicrobia bacterium]|jgi:hypothetical protein|nr:hypothetical protein [Candidatus Neomarinimicrobiota bacterium]